MKILEEKYTKIINDVVYMTISSATREGKPWNTPVFTAFDKELNFFWLSDKNSQHSKNIQENPSIFIVIYDPNIPTGTAVEAGIYIEATAELVTTLPEAIHARKLIEDRMGHKIVDQGDGFLKNPEMGFYKATPQRIWTNTVLRDKQGKYIKDIKKEIIPKIEQRPSELLKPEDAKKLQPPTEVRSKL